MAIELIAVLVGAAFGIALAWLGLRQRSAGTEARLSLIEKDLATSRDEAARQQEANSRLREQSAALESTLQHERQSAAEKLELINRATDELREAFQALASDALKSNNQSFLQLAQASLEKFQSEAKGDLEARQKAVETLVAPIKESLNKVDSQIQQIEKERSQAYGTLTEQVQSLIGTQKALQTETGNLVKALRTPSVRGRWGEIQLKRVVEIAGMEAYCDFDEQVTVTTSDGRLRPDLVVKLPGGKNVVVDAKTPLQSYLEAIEASDDELRRDKLAEHARQVREHMRALASKAYWEQFNPNPEFVVMFLPGETFFSAALEQDPGLIEQGVSQRVIVASPTTLIALLKAVAYGWNQEKLARNAQQISALGKELHDRLRSMSIHMDNLRKGLDRAVESYNRAAGSMESRVMVTARKFPELGAPITEAIPELDQIETTTRTLSLDWGEETTEELPFAPTKDSDPDS
ncbi:MAG TPA: DNA recombination protein RmuC [Terriglobales bacterium]|jgi:DNA recombination protein RmuC|nr:DNA recombination protein RmuC [Terriglobales bacterium]